LGSVTSEINARWFRSNRELRTTYVHREFVRELVIQADRSDSKPQFANGRFVFIAEVAPKGVWHTCLRWLPLTSSKRRPSTLACNAVAGPLPDEGQTHLRRVRIETPNHTVRRAWDQAQLDMASLQLEDPTFAKGVFIPAAGVPWFVTLFGRDSLVVSMQGISGYPEFAAGALRRLSELQATADDPERDMEPGKIPHEIRHGELAQLRILPFQPYYGTHDATSLFVIVISYLYQWLGDVAVLERYLPNAEAAMRWIDQSGDRDRDGFQEYKTRSTHGYYNQGWKDAGDAIPHADGSLAPLPLALCELQGYVYDAKQRMADIYEILGRGRKSARLRAEARELYDRFNDAFWWEAEGTYYLGLDGDKRPIESVASNAGHCLASGIVPPERAVIWRHALRNALSPQLTSFGLTLAFAITGSVVIETVFAWPGLGQLAYQAMLSRDYPLIQGTVLLVAVFVLSANLMVDVLYAYVDELLGPSPNYILYARASHSSDPAVREAAMAFREHLIRGMAFNHLGTERPSKRLRAALAGYVAFVEATADQWREQKLRDRGALEQLLADVLVATVGATAPRKS